MAGRTAHGGHLHHDAHAGRSLFGLELLPRGRRHDVLLAVVRAIFDVDLAGRVLPFDTEAALEYPDISARRRRSGQPISQIDAQIAATVRSRHARLATRNTRDFMDYGIVLVDPWQRS